MKKKLILFSVFIATMSALAAGSGEVGRTEKGERLSDFMNYAAHKLKTEESVIIQMN